MPGQTIEDVARAEAVFLEKVIALHPEADGKPCVIGNCQAGWAVMMLAAIRPELFGPIIIAGSPLSYWAGVHGKNPMRYSGGLLGGSWLTALHQRSRPRQVRRRLAGAEFREPEPREHALDQAVQSLFQDRHRSDRAISVSSAGGEATSISTPRRSSSSSTSCSSATISPPERSRHRTAPRSTFATSALPSWCSARRATTSRRRSRRSDGFSTCTRTSTRSAPTARPSSTPSTRASAISASSCPAASPERSTASSRAISI